MLEKLAEAWNNSPVVTAIISIVGFVGLLLGIILPIVRWAAKKQSLLVVSYKECVLDANEVKHFVDSSLNSVYKHVDAVINNGRKPISEEDIIQKEILLKLKTKSLRSLNVFLGECDRAGAEITDVNSDRAKLRINYIDHKGCIRIIYYMENLKDASCDEATGYGVLPGSISLKEGKVKVIETFEARTAIIRSRSEIFEIASFLLSIVLLFGLAWGTIEYSAIYWITVAGLALNSFFIGSALAGLFSKGSSLPISILKLFGRYGD